MKHVASSDATALEKHPGDFQDDSLPKFMGQNKTICNLMKSVKYGEIAEMLNEYLSMVQVGSARLLTLAV